MTKLANRTPTTPTTPLERNDIWSQMDRLFNELHSELYSGFWPSPFRFAHSWDEGYLRARTDVLDQGSAYEIRADLPGVPKDKIEVTLTGNSVRISASAAGESQEDGKNYLWRERSYQGFERVFDLPEPVVSDKVQARFENGVLTVSVPKAHPAQEKKVEIQ